MDLSLAKLLQIVTVARHGSISRAAAELNISQPALSRSIVALEERYGFAIFNRSGHGVTPTAAGTQVLEDAASTLQRLQLFERNMALLNGGLSGTLKLGLAPLLASQVAGLFTADFFETGTEAQLRIMIRPGIDLLAALRSDEIELFFYPETHIQPDQDITTEVVGSITPTCVVRRGHPLLRQSSVSLEEARMYHWASSVEDPVGPDLPNGADMVCDNYHILRDVVASTDLICVCSTEFVAAEVSSGKLVALQIDGLPMRRTAIHVAKLKGRLDSPLAAAAARRLKQYLDDGGRPAYGHQTA